MKMKSRVLRKSLIWTSRLVGLMLLLPIMVVLGASLIIRLSAGAYLYDNDALLPFNKTALVLGTSHRIRDGSPNPYFHSRMDAAAHLYHSGKVSYLIVSGDNRTRWYNEPEQMKQELIARDVPEEKIYTDHAGLRTLDSVIRCHEVFGQDSFTIVSQEFHNLRAVFIARRLGLNAVGYNARSIPAGFNNRVQGREWLARVNVFVDMFHKRRPAYTGEAVKIGE